MKKRITLFCLLAFLCSISNAVAQCTTATNGLFPANTYTPNCSGNYETLTSQSYASEYSNVNVIANKQYSFSSSVTTDYITITNATGTVVYASGTQPVIWDSGNTTGVIRYYLHSNANCGSEQVNRSRYIRCADASNCVPPSNLTVSNITSNSCKITWTAASPVPSSNYDIYIVTTNSAPTANSTPTLFSTTNLSTSISINVAAGTTYYYWIRSNCGATLGSWISGGNFTTPTALTCNGAIYGLYPDATFTPACTGNTEQIVADAYAGEYSNVNVLTNRQYTFSSSVSTDFITITNTTGTTILASGVTPLNWLSGTYSGVVRYHINSNSSCGTQASNRVRNIQCMLVNCGVPSNLAVSNITSNSCRLSWSAPATVPTNYDIYISTTNIAPTSTSTASATNTTAGVGVLNGLSAATTYYYWIRSNCNGTKSTWVSGGNFTTLAALTCNGATNGLYPETTFTPSCTGNTEQIVSDAYAGEYANVNILTDKQYTFTSSVTTDFITITNQGGTTVLASGLTPLIWNSNFTGIIRYHINTNANCGIQNSPRVRSIKCSVATGCNAPTQLFTDPESASVVNIVWSASVPAPSNGYVYCYSTVNDPFSTGAITGTTTNTFASLSNLSPNTTYYFWVKANCGTTQSNWSSGSSFTTSSSTTCNLPTQLFTDGLTSSTVNIAWVAPTPAPSNGYMYCYSTVNDPFSTGAITGTTTNTFASLSNLSPNTTYYFWVKSICGNTTTNWTSGGSFTTTAASTTCNAPTQLFTDGLTSSAVNIAWVAPTTAPSNGYMYCYSTVNDPFSTSAITGTTTNTFASLSNLSPNTTYYFWVKSICGNTTTNWTSGGSFTTAATSTTCNAPTQLYADIETTTIVNIGWVAPTPAPSNGYMYCYSTVNDPFSTGAITGTTTDTFASLSNLSPNTTYYFWVKSICGNTTTNWTSGGSFTTAAASTTCNAPTQLYTDGLTSSAVNIAWVAPTPAPSNGYTYCYSTVNDPFSTGAITGTTTNTFASLSNLSPNTTYYFWVKSICGNTTTNWTSGGSFTTAATSTTCNAPTQLYTDGLTSSAVNIAWVAPTPAPSNGYMYCYSTVNDPFSTSAITGTTTNTFASLSNLSPNTTYYFWVKSICGNTTTNWTSGGSFTTTAASTTCNAPTQLYTDGLTSSAVNIAWVAPTPAPSNGYMYCYSTVNDPFSTSAITGTTTNTFASLSNLSPNTTYYFWVKSICGNTTTNWTSGGSFTTHVLAIEFFTYDKIKVYPNPVKTILTISLDRNISTVSVYNLLGQELITKAVNSNETTIDIAHLTTGTYWIKVSSNNEVKTVKIIKQ